MEKTRISDVILLSDLEDEELLFGQFLDDFYIAEDKFGMIQEEPPFKQGKEVLLCFLASTAHKLSNDYSLPVPNWVFSDKYILNYPYYAFETKNVEYQKHLEESTPIEFKSRNVLCGDNILSRC